MHIWKYIHVYIHTNTHTNVYMYTYTGARLIMYIYTLYVYIYIYIYISIYIYIYIIYICAPIYICFPPIHFPINLLMYSPFIFPPYIPFRGSHGNPLSVQSIHGPHRGGPKTVFGVPVCCYKELTAYANKHEYCGFITMMTTGTGKVIQEVNKDM